MRLIKNIKEIEYELIKEEDIGDAITRLQRNLNKNFFVKKSESGRNSFYAKLSKDTCSNEEYTINFKYSWYKLTLKIEWEHENSYGLVDRIQKIMQAIEEEIA